MSIDSLTSVVFEAGGETYRLHYPLRILAKAQLELGVASFDKIPERLMGTESAPSADMNAMLILVRNGIKKRSGEEWIAVDDDEAGDLDIPIEQLALLVAEALTLSMTGSKLVSGGAQGEPPLVKSPTN